jgi:carbamoyl-phosphate synthase large subunit
MITVMVTGVGSNIGQGIIKSIRMSGIDTRIIGTDMNPLSAGLFRCDEGYVIPPVDSEDCLKKIIELCNKKSIDMILIGSDPEVAFFSSNKTTIEKNMITRVLVSNPLIVNTFHDKWETVNFLKRRELNCPKSSLKEFGSIKKLQDEVGFPLLIKPRIGAGSKKIFIAKDENELGCALTFVSDPVIQEYIKGEEFTSGVFFDRESKIKGIITMKRDLSFGTTYRAIVDDFPEIKIEIMKVAEELSRHGAIGPINIQSRYHLGKLYTIEINPRFSGTTAFRAKFNFNESEAVLRHFILGEEINEFRPSKGIVMRYWEEVYVGLEDGEQIMKKGFIKDSSSTILRVF